MCNVLREVPQNWLTNTIMWYNYPDYSHDINNLVYAAIIIIQFILWQWYLSQGCDMESGFSYNLHLQLLSW